MKDCSAGSMKQGNRYGVQQRRGDVQAVAVSSDQKLAAVLTEEELDIIQVADGQIKQKKDTEQCTGDGIM